MNLLSFYLSEKQHQAGKPLHDWLLAEARAMGLQGGSAFRAIAGFGRHGRMHEDTFFELAGELAVKVEFIMDDDQAEQFMQKIRAGHPGIFFVRHKVESGTV